MSDEIVLPREGDDPINTDILPCCGAASLRARMDKESVDAKLAPFDEKTKWHCDECGESLPEWYMVAVRKANSEFEAALGEKLTASSGMDTKATAVVLPKKQPPEPEDPRFKHQKTLGLAFVAGHKAGKDPYAICPYPDDTPMYKHWKRGYEAGRLDYGIRGFEEKKSDG